MCRERLGDVLLDDGDDRFTCVEPAAARWIEEDTVGVTPYDALYVVLAAAVGGSAYMKRDKGEREKKTNSRRSL